MEPRFTTITDLYAHFRDYFESEPDNLYEITRDLKFRSGKRFDDITSEDLNAWWEEINNTPAYWDVRRG